MYLKVSSWYISFRMLGMQRGGCFDLRTSRTDFPFLELISLGWRMRFHYDFS